MSYTIPTKFLAVIKDRLRTIDRNDGKSDEELFGQLEPTLSSTRSFSEIIQYINDEIEY
jgi:hypothetical protein